MEFQAGAVKPIGNIEEGWNIIKSDYWLFFAMALVAAIIVIGVSLLLNAVVGAVAGILSVAVGVATSGTDGGAASTSLNIAQQVISQVLGTITGVVTVTLSGVLNCGLYIALSRRINGETLEFGNLFEGFKFLQSCFVVALIVTLINFIFGLIVLLTAFALGVSTLASGMMTRRGTLDPNLFGALFGVIVVMFLVYAVFILILNVCTIFAFPLIASRGLSGTQALALSVRAGLSNVFGLLGLFIVQGVMTLAGILACGVGVFFVLPIVTAGVFAAYLSVFGRTPYSGNNQQMPPPPPIFNNQANF